MKTTRTVKKTTTTDLIGKKKTLQVQHTFSLISIKQLFTFSTLFLLLAKNNFARAAHSFVHFLVCTTKTSNFFYFPIYTFYGENVCVPVPVQPVQVTASRNSLGIISGSASSQKWDHPGQVISGSIWGLRAGDHSRVPRAG